MTTTVRINASLDKDLLQRIDAFAQSRQEDRSTAIRQLVDLALTELAKNDALQAYRQGRVTLREFARMLGITNWAAHDLLASAGVAVGRGVRNETLDDMEALLEQTPSGGRS
jgi:predicted DNA binding protein